MKNIVLACVGLCIGTLLAAGPAQPAKEAKADKVSKVERGDGPAKSEKGDGSVGGKESKAAKGDGKGQAAKPGKPGKMTLHEACEHIAEVVKDPVLMGEITKQLEAEDQKKFMIEVNKAIVSMPGSNEQKTATFLAVEREALVSAEKGNLQSLVATMFATVPLESQTVLAERYAEDLFDRSADSEKTLTDEQFTEVASSTVKEVAAECDGLQDKEPRVTLAIWLFEKASNDTIPDLEDRLLEVGISDQQTREVAKNEWLAQAKNESADRFSSMLGYAEAGRAPNVDVVLQIAGPQVMTASLNDLAQCVTDSNGNQIMPVTQGESSTGRDTATISQTAQAVTATAQDQQQPKTDALVPYNPSYSRSQVQEIKEAIEEAERKPEPEPEPEPEPKPYPYQG